MEVKFGFPAMKAGTIIWNLRVKSGGYRGLDHHEEITVKILEPNSIKRVKLYYVF